MLFRNVLYFLKYSNLKKKNFKLIFIASNSKYTDLSCYYKEAEICMLAQCHYDKRKSFENINMFFLLIGKEFKYSISKGYIE